ncbi:MAG: putative periplasmic serine endoprotease DegP-like precursor [Planctomycetota bacterium]
MTKRVAVRVISLFCACCFMMRGIAGQDLLDEQEQAIQSAVARVAPSVVRIEAIGGLEKVGQVLVGSGPTSGLIVSSDGFIISSSFNFAQKPTSILVTLPDGKRVAAKIVAEDQSRMLVLLKVASDSPLTVPESVNRSEMQVGQTVIALGRTFDSSEPNVSVGILSAIQRIWSKAIQTDAKISPANYGGPLIDLRGNVLGVLAPLSTQASSEVAGTEWYDSGIGFAVPLADILQNLEQLKSGKNLVPGLLGVSIKGTDLFATDVVIGAVSAKGPAAKAGIRPDDKIVAIDGKPIRWQAELKHALGPKYAGETTRIAVLRGTERIESDLTLTDRVEPYEHPFVGILPARDPVGGNATGIEVRYVYPKSGAERARLQAKDRIVSVAGVAVENASVLRERIASFELGSKVPMVVRRGGQSLNVEVELGPLPREIPSNLPRPRSDLPPAEARPPTGLVPIKLPEDEHECFALIPSNFDPRVSYGVVVWIHAPGGFDEKQIEVQWKAACEQHDLIVLAPKSADASKWLPTEIPFIRKALDQVIRQYPIDATRVVAHGYQAGGAMAYLLGFGHRDVVRGVAVVDAGVPARVNVPENDPLERLGFYSAFSEKSKAAAVIQAGIQRLEKLKYPFTVKRMADAKYLSDEEIKELVTWIDSLDRI